MRYLLSILLLTLTLSAQWIVPKRSAAFQAVAASGVANEGFETSEGNFDLGSSYWSETDPNSVLSTYSTTDYVKGTHCLAYVDDGGDRVQLWARYDSGSQQATMHIRFYFKGGDLGADSRTCEVAYLNDFTSGPSTPELTLRYGRFSSQPQLVVLASVNSSAISISAQTWYRVEIDHVAGSNASYMKIFAVGGSQVGSTVTYTPTSTQPRYAFFGSGANNWVVTSGFYLRYDNVSVTTTSGDIGANE